MGYCDIHRRELGLFESCPLCEQEANIANREKEHHEELLNEQRRQSELYERSLDEQREVRKQRERHENEILRLEEERLFQEQMRIEEEKSHRKDETINLELRTGLPEFNEKIQKYWRALHDELSGLMKSETEYKVCISEEQKAFENNNKQIEEFNKKLFQAVEENFNKTINEGKLNINYEKVPWFLEKIKKIYDNLENNFIDVEKYFIIIPSTLQAQLPQDNFNFYGKYADKLLSRLIGIKEKLNNLHLPPEKIVGLSFFLTASGLSIFIILLFGSRMSSAVLLIFLLSFFLFGFFAFYKTHIHSEISLNFKNNLLKIIELSELITNLANESDNENKSERFIVPIRYDEFLQNTISKMNNGLNRLRSFLMNEFFESEKEKFPIHRKINDLLLAMQKNVENMENLKMSYDTKAPEREKFNATYAYWNNEIRRVGREIIGGLRVAGKIIEDVNCITSNNIHSSETIRCPFCGENKNKNKNLITKKE